MRRLIERLSGSRRIMAEQNRGWSSIYIRFKDKRTRRTKWRVIGKTKIVNKEKDFSQTSKFANEGTFGQPVWHKTRDWRGNKVKPINPMRIKKQRTAYVNESKWSIKKQRNETKWHKVGSVAGIGTRSKKWQMSWSKPPK